MIRWAWRAGINLKLFIRQFLKNSLFWDLLFFFLFLVFLCYIFSFVEFFFLISACSGLVFFFFSF